MSLLGLVADYGDESSSSSESEDESSGDDKSNNVEGKSVDQEQAENPLPLPNLDISKSAPGSSSRGSELTQRATQSSSVFYNPFLAEEKKKLSVLEKHVQLSNIKEPTKSRQSKSKICFKFQKGKCRFGDKCKFSHGDPTSAVPSGTETKPSRVNPSPTYASQVAGYTPEPEDIWETKKLAKKHKSGVTDSLVPPKRSLNAYGKQQATERPWSIS